LTPSDSVTKLNTPAANAASKDIFYEIVSAIIMTAT